MSVIDSEDFVCEASAAIQGAARILTSGKPAFSLRCVESEEELSQVVKSVVASGDDSVALLQVFEHKLRSYVPQPCWLLMTLVTTNSPCVSYLIDLVRFKTVMRSSVGQLTKCAAILKVVESGAVLNKLFKEFGCETHNVIVAQKALETTSCHSTVLIEQDFRVRPPSQS